jgi:hypothetical protein
MMARPYPTKNANLLDSFLEHKIENERLTKRIADLKRRSRMRQKHSNDTGSRSRKAMAASPHQTRNIPSETLGSVSISSAHSQDYNAMPPPAKPSLSNTALTAESG